MASPILQDVQDFNDQGAKFKKLLGAIRVVPMHDFGGIGKLKEWALIQPKSGFLEAILPLTISSDL